VAFAKQVLLDLCRSLQPCPWVCSLQSFVFSFPGDAATFTFWSVAPVIAEIEANNSAVRPTSCISFFLILTRERYRSNNVTERNSVSGIKSNLKCTYDQKNVR